MGGIDVISIRMKNFMVHTDTELEFPTAGVVVISGANGSGKSAIVDAVHWALFNSTIRKTTPAPPSGKHPSVELTTGAVDIRREKKAGRVTWNLAGEEPDEWETNTKAQEGLEKFIGDKSVWQRTHYFSSESSGFASATDSNRKCLLESLLGLGHFEVAYRDARSDLTTAVSVVRGIEQKLATADARHDGMLSRYDEMAIQLEALVDVEPTDHQFADIREDIDKIKRKLAKIDDEIDIISRKRSDAAAALSRAKRDVQVMSDDICPTCGQSIGDDMRDRVGSAYHKIHAECVTMDAAASEKLGELRARRDKLSNRLESKSRAAGHAAQQKSARMASSQRRSELLERMARLEDDIDDHADEIKLLRDEHDTALQRVAELGFTAQVLGPQGYRATMITDALGGVTNKANSILAVLTDEGISIELRAYTDTATGGSNDSISLLVNGAGGGAGHRACSLGQRRRIDAAIVLALASLSGAHGTMFFDEVFDGLDAEGTDRLADLLEGLASDRVVVVVTHSVDLARRLRAAKHWHVRDGKVS